MPELEVISVEFRNRLDLKTKQHPLFAFDLMNETQTLDRRKSSILEDNIELALILKP